MRTCDPLTAQRGLQLGATLAEITRTWDPSPRIWVSCGDDRVYYRFVLPYAGQTCRVRRTLHAEWLTTGALLDELPQMALTMARALWTFYQGRGYAVAWPLSA